MVYEHSEERVELLVVCRLTGVVEQYEVGVQIFFPLVVEHADVVVYLHVDEVELLVVFGDFGVELQ